MAQYQDPSGKRLGRKVTGGVVAFLILNGLAGAIAWRATLVGRKQSDSTNHSQSVIVRIEAVLVHFVDAHMGVSGFAVTGDQAMLARYAAGAGALSQDLALLRQLTADDPAQQRRLDLLDVQSSTATRFAEEMVAERRRTNAVPAAAAFVGIQRRMDAVRATIQEMQAEEDRLLAARAAADQDSQRVATSMIVLGTLLGFAYLTLAGIAIHREIRKNIQAQADIRALNATLEERVEQRTAALQTAETRLRASEEMYRLFLDGITDYAVYMLNLKGEVASWNTGAERIKGYTAEQILGEHFSCFYTRADRVQNLPEKALEEAVQTGRNENRGWRVRRDGSEFWGDSIIAPMYDERGALRGFSKVVRDISAQKEVEDRLHESQDQLKGVIQSAMDGVITVDERQRVVLFNAAAERIFGCPVAEALDQPLSRFIPERFRSAHDGHIRDFSETGVTSRVIGVTGCVFGMRSNGEEFPIENSISQVEVGGKKLFTAIVRDVTERERIQAELREQAQLLDLAQVLARDLNGSIVLWNLGAERLYGFTKEEALGRVSQELLHTEFPEAPERIEEKLLDTGRWEGEVAHRKRDGSRIVVSSVWVLQRDAGNRPVRVLEANVDITARKQAEDELGRAEQALREQTRMLHSVLDSMGEGLIAADQSGRFILWNRAAKNILGREIFDLPVDAWVAHYGIYGPDGVTAFATADLPLVCALRGQSASSEMMIHNPALGVKVWIEATARPLKDERGAMSGGVVAFRDITKRKADEREIRQLTNELEQRVIQRTGQLEAANKELEAFTYSVSHDLRAPLRHIAGFSGMLIEELDGRLDERSKKLLQRIEDGTRTMGQMVDELLNLARVGRQAPNLQVTGLSSIVDEVLGVLSSDCEGREIDWRIGPLPFVECDPPLIRLVFQNLISNALKYSRPRSPAVIEIGKTRENAIFVRDNGVGFSMKYADKLFGVFQRLHRAEDFEGTGVGLATVQRIIQKHGGRIWAEAELDRGAAFYFTLSAAEADADQAEVNTVENAYETS